VPASDAEVNRRLSALQAHLGMADDASASSDER
jgi:hypothetical protein